MRMRRTYAAVRQYSQNHDLDFRTACYGIAVERIQEAYEERGIFP
jgi:glutamate dehydrogenase (NAD(P)+)